MNEPQAPIEEQIVRVFKDFRYRRLKHAVDHPESITNEDLIPENLSRHAEAVEVLRVVRADTKPR